MTARAAFKQSDVERACKAAAAAGLSVARIVINDNGIEVVIGPPAENEDMDWRSGSPLYRNAQ